MPDPLITEDVPGTVIPLDPASNSKSNAQGNEESGSVHYPGKPSEPRPEHHAARQDRG